MVLEDGTSFYGKGIGALGVSVGEVVFNTSMTGYQEILTDPSYAEQIVTLTYPHIGNTGTNSADSESDTPWIKGLVIRDLPLMESNFRNEQSLSDYLTAQGVLGICNIDTRHLTRILRQKGALNACLMTVADQDELDIEVALTKAQSFLGIKGMDLAKQVSTITPYTFSQTTWTLEHGYGELDPSQAEFHVVAYDYGVKHNLLRHLVERGCRITVVPAQTPASEVLAMQPDGIFLSNGPGDPAACDYAINAVQHLLTTNIPLFGICLGHQILCMACGANTMKMKFGHHGANHPVKNLATNQVMITSQNHGFAVDEDSLPPHLQVTHQSLFDGTLQGVRHLDKPAFGFQGHPEASPGPHEAAVLFDNFIQLMKQK